MFDIYGILATETPDRVGEVLSIDGADISDLRFINDEHKSDRCFDILGQVKKAKKIYKSQDCEDQFEIKCWNRVKKPFIYIYGSLATPEHPNASAAEGLIKYSAQNPGFPVGFSVEGATVERKDKLLSKTKVIAASLTVKPCNTECIVFPAIDLTKSFEIKKLPEHYKDSIAGRKHFYNLPSQEQRLLAKSELLSDLKDLLKSGEPIDQATVVKCWNCGEAKLFMKSRLPNRCTACSERFSMLDLYRARTADPFM